jgi:uncharacterized protein (TIGR00251 family)
LKQEPAGAVKLSLRVAPGASKNEISFTGGVWKVRLTAPPVEGKANRALVCFLADKLGVSRSRVRLAAGATSRAKTVEVYGLSREEIESRMAKYTSPDLRSDK